MHSPELSRDTATAGEAVAHYLHAQAGDFLRSLRLHGESGADTAGASEAARALRAAARRISGTLYTFRPLLDPVWADGLRAELGWLSSTLALEHACTSRLSRLLDALSRLSGASPLPPARTELSPLPAAPGTAPTGRTAAPGTADAAHGAVRNATTASRHAAGSSAAGSAAGRDAAGGEEAGAGAPGHNVADRAARHGAAGSQAAEASRAGRKATAAARHAAGSSAANATLGRDAAGGEEARADAPEHNVADCAARRGAAGSGAAASRHAAGRDAAGGGEAGGHGGTDAEALGAAARGGGNGAGAVGVEAGHKSAHASRGGVLNVGAARAGALLERQLTLARTRAHSAALQALGSSRFHAVADAVALLASELPPAPAAAGPAAETLGLLAEVAERRLLDAVARLPLGRAAHPYNAEALANGLATATAGEEQDAPWHEVRRLLRLHRYAQEVLHPDADPVLCRAGLVLDHHRDAAEASEAAAAAARTPRIAPATAYALGVLHADQRHQVEAARFAFQQEWRHATVTAGAP
ncbi:CHAD domain-containing protein [Streptomyces sp. 5K101]|uniref:CHAD domain-containing protein n=1 Tax=Streptomyces sp. 5K101 TaxID=3390037 RepID=UPI003974D1F4